MIMTFGACLSRARRAFAVAPLGMVLLTVAAPATAQTYTVFTTPTANSQPAIIVTGPDGALWFTETNAGKIGRLTTGGALSEVGAEPNENVYGIVVGPDGALWVSEDYHVARYTTAGVKTLYTTPGNGGGAITSGPGGLWYGTGGGIQLISTSGTFGNGYNTPDTECDSLVAGPDGALWFTENLANKVGRMTTGGSFTMYTLPNADSLPNQITPGPDGALWFTEGAGRIGRITTGGSLQEFTLPANTVPYAITTGRDGALWFTNVYDQFNVSVGRITTSGVATGFNASTQMRGLKGAITVGPDDAFWFTGGYGDANQIGRAAFPVAAHDFNGDGKSDILWRNTGGTVAAWLMNGGTVLQSAALGTLPSSFSIIGQHDFNGDGNADILWRDTSGNVSMWFMNGATVGSAAAVGNLTSNWTLYGTGDLNGDGKGDLLWRDASTGTVAVWFMNGAAVASTAVFGALPSTWTIVGDANGDILWRDSAGDIALWGVQNGQVTSSSGLGTVTSNFVAQGVGDFNGDGKIDILWRDTNSGALSIWFTNGTQVTSGAGVGALPSNWNVAQVGDYNGDGNSDILLLDSAGDVAMWLMNGATVSSSVGVGNVGTTWQVQNLNAN